MSQRMPHHAYATVRRVHDMVRRVRDTLRRARDTLCHVRDRLRRCAILFLLAPIGDNRWRQLGLSCRRHFSNSENVYPRAGCENVDVAPIGTILLAPIK